MKRFSGTIVAMSAVITCLLSAHEARSAAFAGAYAYYAVYGLAFGWADPLRTTPISLDGIVLAFTSEVRLEKSIVTSGDGVASAEILDRSYSDGTSFQIHLTAKAATFLHGTATVESVAFHDFAITNLSDAEIMIGLTYDFSGFNPGGPPIGASVSDTRYEFASFRSSVQGATTGGPYNDWHTCSTDYSHLARYTVIVPPFGVQCGVGSPDFTGGFGIIRLPAGETYRDFLHANIYLSVSSDVPLPSPLALLIGPMMVVTYKLRQLKNNSKAAQCG